MSGRPQVIAHHLVWTGYGWWLPNDPRGSGSREVRTEVLRDLGDVHLGRKRIQPPGHVVREFYDRAHPRLAHAVLRFDRQDVDVVGEAIGRVIDAAGYTCWAAAVMPDHVHLVVRRHRDRAEAMIERIQGGSRGEIATALGADPDHPVWTDGGYKVFLSTPEDIRRSVRYVERNPDEIGWDRQQWPFVVEYDGWPLSGKH